MQKKKMFKFWTEMKRRCDDESHSLYKKYGGQGIGYQDSWKDFDAFYEDMKTSYPSSVVLDRYNPTEDYTKNNCFWLDILNPEIDVEKYKQKKVSPLKVIPKYHSFNGEINNATGFAKQYNIHYQTLRYRLLRGWTIDRALSVPTIEMKRRRKDRNM